MTPDLLDLYERASDWTLTQGGRRRTEAGRPTPCDEWDVRHADEPHAGDAALLRRLGPGRGRLAAVAHPARLLGDDPVADFEQARARPCAPSASRRGHREDRSVARHRVQRPAPARLGPGEGDRTGRDHARRPPEAAYEMIHGRFTDEQRKGVFKPEVAVAATRPPRTSCSRTPVANPPADWRTPIQHSRRTWLNCLYRTGAACSVR